MTPACHSPNPLDPVTAAFFWRSKADTLLKVDVVPDYDRSGVIDQEDYQKAAGDDPFYFWVNDDRDQVFDYNGDPDNSDTPSGNSVDADSNDTTVDGVRDLIDFFPVFIDLHGLLDNMDVTKVQIELLGPEVAWLDFPEDYIGLTENSARFYLDNVVKAEEWGDVSTTTAGDGVYFTQKMVERIRDGRGIVLLEGREVSDDPLQLRFSYDGTELFTYDMELKLSNVEDMYRHLDLRPEATEGANSPYSIGTRLSEPTGWPESSGGPANDIHFIFLHGYRVDGEAARGTFAEVFKRMYHSGSNARFTGVTWYGNASLGNDYWENVIHAFESSEALADTLNNNSAFSGTRVIAAHSLGNMVVSSAIADYGLTASAYYMLDAAVAKEAYDSLLNASEQGSMRNPNWVHSSDGLYDWRLWASHWHLLFKDSGSPFGSSLDERSELTWRGRFGVLPQAHNFYSSTENVLKNNNSEGSNPGISPVFTNGGERAWVAQEMNKGLDNLVTILNDDSHGGWMFNYTPQSYPNGWMTPALLPTYRTISPSEYAALGLSDTERDEALRNMPFFREFKSSDSDYPDYDSSGLYEDLGSGSLGGTADAKYITRAKILSEAMPSLSFAAGSNEIGAFGQSRNYDMYTDLRNGSSWPSDHPDDDWLHGDFKDIAYQYVYPLFDKFVELGNLDQ